MDPIMEEDDVKALSFQLEALKEGIYKRDTQIKQLEDRFTDEKNKSENLEKRLKEEEQKNEDGEARIERFEKKLAESNELIEKLREQLGLTSSSNTSEDMKTRLLDVESQIKDVQDQVELWKSRCDDLESSLEEEKLQHEQVKFKLSQSEQLIMNYRDSDKIESGDAGEETKYQNIISGLKASIDVQSERNIELHQQLQYLRKDSEDAKKMIKSLEEGSDKDKKLIDELNNQNQREYQRNEKLRTDIQRLKRDIDSWRKIQTDMKAQYQDLRMMYDGVCKHADDQKREMLELKLLMDRDKRSIARQREEIDKLKVRSTSLKQTYEDIKEKYDETFKLLEEKKAENRSLNSQLQTAKKMASELTASNKDLKKRSEFSQKELIDKHKLLLQTEERVKDLEHELEEKDTAFEESKTQLKEANEKAEKCSNEAAAKERDLMDRIALLQKLQNKIQTLEDDNKKLTENEEKTRLALVGKDTVIKDKDKDIKERETIVYELEQRIIVMEKSNKEMEEVLDKVQNSLMNKDTELSEFKTTTASIEQNLADKHHKISELSEEIERLEETNEALKTEYNKKENNHQSEKKSLFQQLELLAAEQEKKEKQIATLNQDLQEVQQKVDLQNELLKEAEVKFEGEDGKLIEYEEDLKKKELKINELEMALDEKQRVMEELKRELEESEIIQVYLNEIDSLKKVVSQEMSRNEQLQQMLEINKGEEASTLEEEKKEVMLQMTKELKRERQKSQAIIADLKDDIRILENNIENEKERSNMLNKEIELKERKRNSERESFLQHIEELQELYSKEKQDKYQMQEKVKALEVQLRDTERKRLNEIEEFEQNKLQILTETKSNLILDRQEKIEELKDELQNKTDLLLKAESCIGESNKKHENEKLELQVLCNEKDDLIASLRKENFDLRKGWQEESEWMEENKMTEKSQPEVLHTVTRKENDEGQLLISQSKAIQEIKQKIEVDFKLDQLLPSEQTDESRLDILYEKSLKSQEKVSKREKIRMVVEKLAIVILLSPLAFFFSCEFSLTLAAVVIPLAYIIHQKPWRNTSEHEKALSETLNGLSARLAAECADSNNLRQTIDYLKRQAGYSNNNNDYSSDKVQQQFSDERQLLIKELERQSKEEHEKQKEELLRIKQKQEADRRRLQRQQALIDKLEVILQEKEIKSRLGQFWGYEELKMAIIRLKHEREVEKSRSECSEDDNIQKRVAMAVEEATSKENSRKVESFIAVAILSSILVICFSVNFSFSLTIGCLIVIASCSLVYGVWSWREVENIKSKLQTDKDVIEAQQIEIDELTVLMDKEHDVVSKQKQAIEALERRLNDEYKKNKDHQLTIARLTWVFQESEEMRKATFDAKDPELQILAESHARDKCSIFKSMQKQLEEHSTNTEEQRKVIDELKNATNIIVNAAEKQISHIKSQKESRLGKDKPALFHKISKWALLSVVIICLAVLPASLNSSKMFSLLVPSLLFALATGGVVMYAQRYRKKKVNVELEKSNITRPNLQLSFSVIKQSVYDVIFIVALGVLLFSFSSLSLSLAVTYLVIIVVFRLITYIMHRRSINSELVTWNDVVEDLLGQIHERTELIDVQTEEIQTLKKLLEVERSYSRHAERMLKEAKGISDEGFEELTDMERLKHRASELQTEEDHLVNYELDEMKIFLEEEQKNNVQLRKTLAETEDAKRTLLNECTNLKRKLEMEQMRRKEITMVKEEEGLLKDRIDELIEDLEAEQKTKQELNAQLIEERSSRELSQIELQDIKEKMRDERHASNSLREQVLKLKNNQHDVTTLQKQLEEERTATYRHYMSLIEVVEKLRKSNLDLRGQITDILTSRHLRDQQDDIERLKTLLESIAHTTKVVKYQDLMDELQALRQQLATSEASPSSLLEELELEKEKNKILEEAVEELQRQQSDQHQMLENERRRSVELARQLSGEDIPLMVEQEINEELDDKRGLLYWLGTNGGLTDWKNPGESGLVLISRSSYGHGRATDVANRKPSWCSTSNKPNQWWKVDFGEKRLVVPTAYSLRHGWSGNAGALRHWVCEGSLDGRKWVVLRQHINDETINTAYGYGYWKIPNDEQNVYRFIRVRQTGLNSSGRHALRLCGIEVYGKLEND